MNPILNPALDLLASSSTLHSYSYYYCCISIPSGLFIKGNTSSVVVGYVDVDRRRRSNCLSWGDLEHGAVLRVHSNFGRANQCRNRQYALCVWRWWSHHPCSLVPWFSLMQTSIPSSPMGEPKRWAFPGVTGQRFGATSIIAATALALSLTISDFNWFNWRLNFDASSVKICGSCRTSPTSPPMVASSK